jgi:hypothetical protein
MPVAYAMKAGALITLRESLIAHGYKCNDELPGSLIYYTGTFLDADRVQGAWIIRPRSIRLSNGRDLNMPESTGIWCAEFIAIDLNTVSSGGPTKPFFDKE